MQIKPCFLAVTLVVASTPALYAGFPFLPPAPTPAGDCAPSFSDACPQPQACAPAPVCVQKERRRPLFNLQKININTHERCSSGKCQPACQPVCQPAPVAMPTMALRPVQVQMTAFQPMAMQQVAVQQVPVQQMAVQQVPVQQVAVRPQMVQQFVQPQVQQVAVQQQPVVQQFVQPQQVQQVRLVSTAPQAAPQSAGQCDIRSVQDICDRLQDIRDRVEKLEDKVNSNSDVADLEKRIDENAEAIKMQTEILQEMKDYFASKKDTDE